MARSTLEYYRIFAGWPDGAGSANASLNDFKSMPKDKRAQFCTILESSAGSDRLTDPVAAAMFLLADAEQNRKPCR